MEWIPLTSLEQLDQIDAASASQPILLFKHSTRCSISSAALNRLESAWTAADDAAHTVHYLDLIKYRDVSNAIAERYGVQHESPQLLVIRNGQCAHHASHFGITYGGTIGALNG
jgi:bacillithiol system protein YtxJ